MAQGTSVQSISRAFALLRALAVGPAGVTELAERANLPKSTVSRLLAALEEEGAVTQVETGGEYRLGDTLADLAGAAAPGRNLVTAARPHLQELTRITGESSGLSVLDGDCVYYLDHIDAEEEVISRSWTGQVIPLHHVPSGLALLSGSPPDVVDAYLRQDLAPSTDRSVTDPAAIRDRLDQVRRDGYLWFDREFVDSIRSVAAPVLAPDGTAVAALHVHGPAYRFPGSADPAGLGRLVSATAKRLADQLR